MPKYLVFDKRWDLENGPKAEFDTMAEFEQWMSGESAPEYMVLYERKQQDWVIE